MSRQLYNPSGFTLSEDEMTEILSRNGEVKVLGLTISSIGQKTSNRNHHLGDPSVDGTTYNILRYDIIHIYIYIYAILYNRKLPI